MAKIKRKKSSRPVKRKTKAKSRGKKNELGENFLGKIDHFFGKISVAAMRVKMPLKTGDKIHIMGPHNDFYQDIHSMQIKHREVPKAKRGRISGLRLSKR